VIGEQKFLGLYDLVLEVGKIFSTMPRAWKNLFEITSVLLIWITMLSLYLGGIEKLVSRVVKILTTGK
jgi:hypothetical protein